MNRLTAAEKIRNVVAKESEEQFGLTLESEDKDPASAISFVAGHTRCRADYHCHFTPALHNCFMYFAKGKGWLRHGKSKYTPSGNDLFLLHAGEEWEYKTDPKSPWELYWFNIDAEVGEVLFRLFDLQNALVLSYEKAKERMQSIFQTLALAKRTNADMRDELLGKLMLLLQETSRAKNAAGDDKQSRDARAMRKFIDDHIGENIRSTDVSSAVFRSHSGASILFRRVYGYSIKEYILKTKLETGARLLSETDFPIWKIAAELSFYDARHFSRLFSSHYETTPLHFRKKMRESHPRRKAKKNVAK